MSERQTFSDYLPVEKANSEVRPVAKVANGHQRARGRVPRSAVSGDDLLAVFYDLAASAEADGLDRTAAEREALDRVVAESRSSAGTLRA